MKQQHTTTITLQACEVEEACIAFVVKAIPNISVEQIKVQFSIHADPSYSGPGASPYMLRGATLTADVHSDEKELVASDQRRLAPDGMYVGSQTGYTVEFSAAGLRYTFKAALGVRGIGVPVTVRVVHGEPRVHIV